MKIFKIFNSFHSRRLKKKMIRFFSFLMIALVSCGAVLGFAGEGSEADAASNITIKETSNPTGKYDLTDFFERQTYIRSTIFS